MGNYRKRRTKRDRRQFNYTAYFPERRSGEDRREITVNNFRKTGGLRV